MLFKLMSYFIGYVAMIVTGKAPEKFVNMAASRGIYLWDISRIGENAFLLKTRVRSVKPLRHIARRTGCRYHIRSKIGLPFVTLRIKRRKVLAVGFFFFLGALYLLSSLVWSIEVKGNQLLTETEVLDAANESGLTRWTLKWGLEPGEVEAGIAERLPLVSWTGVYINGTRVIIEVAERVLPEDEEKSPAHLVAAKAGIIKEVLVLSGNPLVYEGDTVAQGQVLISGEIPALWEKNIENGAEVDYKLIREADYVHAKGIVRARVWYESYGQAELIETGYRLTGRFQKRYVLRYNDTNEIILWGGKDIAYVDYETETDVKKLPQWRNIGLPVEIITVKYLELSGFCEERSLEGAAKIAEEAAVEAIVKQFPQDAVVQGRWMEDVSPANDENIVKVKVAIETVEDIGEEKLFNP